MTDLRTMLLGIRHAGTSDLFPLRDVLADWLEERGDNRSDALRKAPRIKADFRDPRLRSVLGQAMFRQILDGQVDTQEIVAGMKAAERTKIREWFHEQLQTATLALFPEVCICERSPEGFRDACESMRREIYIGISRAFLGKKTYLPIAEHFDTMCPAGRVEEETAIYGQETTA